MALTTTPGKGYVAYHPGDYADALSPAKNNQVVPLIIEVFGGLAYRRVQHN